MSNDWGMSIVGKGAFPDVYTSSEARGKAPDSQWVVADGAEMPFEMHGFDHASAFFSCMYMSEDVKRKVFNETLRVLKPGGELWIWDVSIPAESRVYAIRLQVNLLENRSIKTVYGAKGRKQSAENFCNLLHEAGFTANILTYQKHWFFIRATKAV
ncbi:methyltransferase domain-containing protein [Acidobacteriota bacterium]